MCINGILLEAHTEDKLLTPSSFTRNAISVSDSAFSTFVYAAQFIICDG